MHLLAHATDVELAQQLTKPLLMPALAAWVWARGGPRVLVAALFFGWGGDLALQSGSDSFFLAGMASFAIGHICYLALIRRAGSFTLRRSLPAAVGYAAVCAVMVTLLWPGLDPAMRVPVAGYSVLLTAMAWAALAGVGGRVAAGGALFLLSDALIATRLAEWQQLPAAGLWVMLTYTAAQYLLASGLLRAYARRVSEGPESPAAASSSATSRRGATTR
nr:MULTISPECIES: lysoplasmalogenase [Streptomyces]